MAFALPAKCSFPNRDIRCRGFHSTWVWPESFPHSCGTICIAAAASRICPPGLRLRARNAYRRLGSWLNGGIGNDRIVFNSGGNKYRLVVRINFAYRVVYIRFVGTHRQYDRVNAKEI